MSDSASPASPCIGLCQLDDGGVCLGCRRSIEEIARWTECSIEERRQILQRLQANAPASVNTRCPVCDTQFPCQARCDQGCWCLHVPPLGSLPAQLQGCLCPRCLRAELNSQDQQWRK